MMPGRPRVGTGMLFGSRAKTTLPSADEALPGREHRVFTVPTTHEVLGTPLEGPWPEGTEVALRRDGLLLGRRADLLAAPGGRDDRRRLHGRVHAQPDVRGDLHRSHRARRGGARRLRPVGHLPRAAPQGLLGEPRPHPGEPAGQRHRHGIPLGDLLDHAGAGDGRAPDPVGLPGRPDPARAAATSRRPSRRPRMPARSGTPRTTTSSTSTRTPTATATTAPTASPARSASPTCRPRRTSSRPPDVAGPPVEGREHAAPGCPGAACSLLSTGRSGGGGEGAQVLAHPVELGPADRCAPPARRGRAASPRAPRGRSAR